MTGALKKVLLPVGVVVDGDRRVVVRGVSFKQAGKRAVEVGQLGLPVHIGEVGEVGGLPAAIGVHSGLCIRRRTFQAARVGR